MSFCHSESKKSNNNCKKMANVGNPSQETRSIAKLNVKNWSSWRFEVTLLLEKNRLLWVVLKQELKPAQVVFHLTFSRCSCVFYRKKVWLFSLNTWDLCKKNMIILSIVREYGYSPWTCEIYAKRIWLFFSNTWDQCRRIWLFFLNTWPVRSVLKNIVILSIKTTSIFL